MEAGRARERERGEIERGVKRERQQQKKAIQKGEGGRNEILRVGDVICSSCNQGKKPSYIPPK